MPKLGGKFQVGFTKVFLKEETRAGLEQVLNAACLEQVVTIQAFFRGRIARKFVEKLRKARKTIWKRVLRKVRLQRLMNTLQGVWGEMKKRLIRI